MADFDSFGATALDAYQQSALFERSKGGIAVDVGDSGNNLVLGGCIAGERSYLLMEKDFAGHTQIVALDGASIAWQKQVQSRLFKGGFGADGGGLHIYYAGAGFITSPTNHYLFAAGSGSLTSEGLACSGSYDDGDFPGSITHERLMIPTISADGVYGHGLAGGTSVFDWHVRVVCKFGSWLRAFSQHFGTTYKTIARFAEGGGKLFMYDSGVSAFSGANGSLLWSKSGFFGLDADSLPKCGICVTGDGVVFVGPDYVALNADDGSLLWARTISGVDTFLGCEAHGNEIYVIFAATVLVLSSAGALLRHFDFKVNGGAFPDTTYGGPLTAKNADHLFVCADTSGGVGFGNTDGAYFRELNPVRSKPDYVSPSVTSKSFTLGANYSGDGPLSFASATPASITVTTPTLQAVKAELT